MKFADLQRLLPARRRARAELDAEEMTRLWAQVPDNDPCLRAVNELLDDLLEGNFSVASDPSRPERERLTAQERAGIAVQLMRDIARQHAEAKVWRQKQNG